MVFIQIAKCKRQQNFIAGPLGVFGTWDEQILLLEKSTKDGL